MLWATHSKQHARVSRGVVGRCRHVVQISHFFYPWHCKLHKQPISANKALHPCSLAVGNKEIKQSEFSLCWHLRIICTRACDFCAQSGRRQCTHLINESRVMLGHHTTASPSHHKCVSLTLALQMLHNVLTTFTTMACPIFMMSPWGGPTSLTRHTCTFKCPDKRETCNCLGQPPPYGCIVTEI